MALSYGCRNGACGACRGRVVAGRVHYAGGDAGLRGLTEREVRAGWTLLCQARASSDVRIAARADGAGDGVRTLPARVASRTRLAHDVMELRLQLPPTERLRYRAGQYVDILLRDGRRRAFSLANCPADDALLVLHIRHVPGGTFSGHVFEDLEERSLLRLQGPLGSFYLRADSDCPVVFLAGGTGFAPVKAIIENALLAPLRREMHLYWGVRSERDLYLADLPRAWARAHPRLHFVPVLSEPEPEPGWSGRTGLVHEAVLADLPDLSGTRGLRERSATHGDGGPGGSSRSADWTWSGSSSTPSTTHTRPDTMAEGKDGGGNGEGPRRQGPEQGMGTAARRRPALARPGTERRTLRRSRSATSPQAVEAAAQAHWDEARDLPGHRGSVPGEVLLPLDVPLPERAPAHGPRPQLHDRRRGLALPADARQERASADGLGRLRAAGRERGHRESGPARASGRTATSRT